MAGSSAGAITAALIAGSSSADRLQNLQSYWHAGGWSAKTSDSRHLLAWMSSISTRLFGHTGFFHPRLPVPASHFGGLYDLSPTRERLRQLIDFDRLNDGDPGITICATDVESGDVVLFDSPSGRIELDHILASCGFLPDSLRCGLPAARWGTADFL
ncbi:putative acylesterase/phospholipase RssA [Bradyrhizobium sp. USDA 372]